MVHLKKDDEGYVDVVVSFPVLWWTNTYHSFAS